MNRNLTVGIAGHQKRRGLDWNWVNATLRAELVALGGVSRALSSLAAGADQRFATVALELNIPVTAVLPMSGYELLRELRNDPALKRTPFIMVTSESKIENVIAAKKAGVDNYIVKPFNAHTLKAKIGTVFAARSAPPPER